MKIYLFYKSIREYISQNWPNSFLQNIGFNKWPKIKNLRKRFHHESHTCESCSWDDFCNDLVEKIAYRLSIGDRVRMAAVCKSWKAILLSKNIPTPENPWLIIPHNPENSQEISFYSLSDTKVYKFKLPKLLRGGWCCGTSRGWLIMAILGEHHEPHLLLWNPISRSIMRLPPITTIPCFSRFMEDLDQGNYTNISDFVQRVEVFFVGQSPVKNLVVAAIFRCFATEHEELALCRPHDRTWTVVDTNNIISTREGTDVICNDVIFHKGILYGLIIKYDDEDDDNYEDEEEEEEHKTIEETITTIDLTDCEVKLGFIILDYKVYLNKPLEPEFHHKFWILKKMFGFPNLVESCNGELLHIESIYDVFAKNPGDNNDGLTQMYCQISDFNVKVVDLMSYYKNWKSLTSLGEDQSLFLAKSGSLSRLQSSGSGNTIYFLAEEQCWLDKQSPNVVTRESGVFYLDQRRIKRCFPSLKLPMHCNIGWFTPELHPQS